MKLSARQVAAAAVLVAVVAMLGARGGSAATPTTPTSDVCMKAIAALQTCLPYVGKAKAASPTAGCCGSVKTTVQDSPECLCQFIAMTRQAGNTQITTLGIDQARLALLPSACGLKDVSATNCTNISPTSATGPSSNVTSGNFAYKVHATLPLQALVLLATFAFLLPAPSGLGLDIFV